ncbi:MAG: hypothetical protein ACRD1F_08935 [Terriglobales bacterium]
MEIKSTRKAPCGAGSADTAENSYPDSTERAALIGGFRALADYLESNPEIPAPAYSTVYTFPADGEWAHMCAVIDAVAARLGVAARRTNGGHHVAVRFFGPVEYRAVAIPPKHSTDTESE